MWYLVSRTISKPIGISSPTWKSTKRALMIYYVKKKRLDRLLVVDINKKDFKEDVTQKFTQNSPEKTTGRIAFLINNKKKK